MEEAPESAYLPEWETMPFEIGVVHKPCPPKRIYFVKPPSDGLEKRIFNMHKASAGRKRNIKRGLGFNPLNDYFMGSHAHHLHLENNKDFVIYLPSWLHSLNRHSSKTGKNMFSVASIALDYWLSDYEF